MRFNLDEGNKRFELFTFTPDANACEVGNPALGITARMTHLNRREGEKVPVEKFTTGNALWSKWKETVKLLPRRK